MHDAKGPFCASCAVGLEPLGLGCRTCAEPGAFRDETCPRCQAHPPPFSRAWIPFHHEGPLARAIHRFKYEDHPELARPLAQLLAAEIRTSVHPERSARPVHPERSAPPVHPERSAAESKGPNLADAAAEGWTVCAIPLHRSRYHQRMYDQAELLASELSKALSLPFLGALERTRATQRQVGLSEADREANVKGAFRAVADVRGRNLLLVDDVFTTGSTARAAAGALRDAGANEVTVVALARAATEPNARN